MPQLFPKNINQIKERINMKITRILGAAAACAVAFSLAGCSIKTGTSRFDAIITSINLSDDAVLASPKGEGIENADSLAITYEQFKKEYLYNLKYYSVSYGVESDTDEAYAESFTELRSSILSYLIEETIILDKAPEYGADQFTQEELDQLESEYQELLQKQYQTFGEAEDYSGLESGESPSAEEVLQRGEEAFAAYLADCGLTQDDLLVWQRNALVATKLKEAIVKDITIDRSEAEDVLESYIEAVKEIYKTNPAQYESGSYSTFWIPDGTRNIKHILIAFDDADCDEILALRKEEKDAEADALREECLAPLEEKVDEVLEKLDGGADFDELIKEYSADAVASEYYPDGYQVIPDSTSFVSEFVQAAFELENIGDYKLTSTDYGWHIVLYAGNAEITQEERDDSINYIHENLISTAKEETYTKTVEQWLEDYDFEINYSALNIPEPEQTEEADGESEASDSTAE